MAVPSRTRTRLTRAASLRVFGAVAASLAGLLALGGCAKTVHESDLFYPRHYRVLPDEITRRNIEIVAPDSTVLRGWLLAPPAPRGTLIYFDANASTVLYSQQRLYWFAEALNVNVVAVDYRGYGFSTGKPTLAGIADDAVLVYDRVVADPDIGSGPVVAYGFSLGSAVAVHLASQRPLDGLILEGGFPSQSEALASLRRILPWYVRWFVRLRPDPAMVVPPAIAAPEDALSRINTPLLVIHGEKDELFPLAFGKRMYDASPATRKLWCPVPEAGHNGVVLRDPPASLSLEQFLQAVVPGAR